MAIIVDGKEGLPQLKEGLTALSMETANPGVLEIKKVQNLGIFEHLFVEGKFCSKKKIQPIARLSLYKNAAH